mmetsp:Transcript_7200/g.12695  ORF Transcript_7200/g.12695 Transcript_7200/m.12695 type:complete len:83 (+) Transcript_7200:89-337(+)
MHEVVHLKKKKKNDGACVHALAVPCVEETGGGRWLDPAVVVLSKLLPLDAGFSRKGDHRCRLQRLTTWKCYGRAFIFVVLQL